MYATLIEKGRRSRKLHIIDSEDIYEVVYKAGAATERVLVDGDLVYSAGNDLHSGKVWYSPSIKFPIGKLSAIIGVKINWRFAIDAFSLKVEGHELHVE